MECHYFQTYGGHKDGVWEVSTSKNISTVLGTASAGMLIYINQLISYGPNVFYHILLPQL